MASLFILLVAAVGAQAQVLQVIHDFRETPDGNGPEAGVIRDSAGNLYGTTTEGGAHGWGLVFKLTHQGAGWTLVPLYSFPDPYDVGGNGAEPYAPVIFGSDGSLYGTTQYAGYQSLCCGTVFKLTPPATICKTAICYWTETILYAFTGGSDGGQPVSPVVFDSGG
jgi:uncharacterized repeat protein (TIGR03803 family)